jgi:hypothetical protein
MIGNSPRFTKLGVSFRHTNRNAKYPNDRMLVSLLPCLEADFVTVCALDDCKVSAQGALCTPSRGGIVSEFGAIA